MELLKGTVRTADKMELLKGTVRTADKMELLKGTVSEQQTRWSCLILQNKKIKLIM
jgi:hypothetical protein